MTNEQTGTTALKDADGDADVQGFYGQALLGAAATGVGLFIGYVIATHDPEANKKWVKENFGDYKIGPYKF